jgi:hypothetical protein
MEGWSLFEASRFRLELDDMRMVKVARESRRRLRSVVFRILHVSGLKICPKLLPYVQPRDTGLRKI